MYQLFERGLMKSLAYQQRLFEEMRFRGRENVTKMEVYNFFFFGGGGARND